MIDQIRKTVERISEHLQECAEALEQLSRRDDLVRVPVPVQSNPQYPVSKKTSLR